MNVIGQDAHPLQRKPVLLADGYSVVEQTSRDCFIEHGRSTLRRKHDVVTQNTHRVVKLKRRRLEGGISELQRLRPPTLVAVMRYLTTDVGPSGFEIHFARASREVAFSQPWLCPR